MAITEEIYEAAWAKRKVATEGYRVQFEEDMVVARTLPFGQQTRAAMDAADRYDEACKPAVEVWQRDLGIFKE